MTKKDNEKGSGRPTGGGLKEPLWTIEKIRALKDEELKSLKANAEKKAKQDVIEMCDVVLSERNLNQTASSRQRTPNKRTPKEKRDKTKTGELLEKTPARRTSFSRSPKLSISAHFYNLGAPLKNIRWSWGAIQKETGEIILRVWKDEILEIDGIKYVQLTNMARFGTTRHPGFRERLSHIELLRSGCNGLLLFCEAKNITDRPRKIAAFDKSLSKATTVIEIREDIWIGIGDRL